MPSADLPPKAPPTLAELVEKSRLLREQSISPNRQVESLDRVITAVTAAVHEHEKKAEK